MSDTRNAGNIDLHGGYLCLDFVNTVDWRLSDRPEELLLSYADLVAWSRHVGILSDGQAARLARKSRKSPAIASAMLKQAVRLREMLYRMFSSIARGGTPARADVSRLNRALADSLARMRLVPAAGTFEWGWDESETKLEQPLWHVVQSAAALLTMGKPDRIRQCSDEHCGWLFFDASKNNSRRWCSMKDCGNRAKARRHYRRTRRE